ncbi:MAG: DUF362 domain-containing protein [Candidatus Omnitrophica bacterium]|nr:DUF362 domain-containing protein [Candidatus Omnitrophota bacterium]
MAGKVYYARVGKTDTIPSVSSKLRTLIEKSAVLSPIKKGDFTAIKLHFGEEGNTGHIKHEWVKEAAKCVGMITDNSFLADSNVIYKASRRTNAIDHLKIASEHGFRFSSIGVPVLIADGLRGRNFIEVPVNGKHFKKIKMASDFANADSMLVLTHVTGHILTGVGGALKNIAMGCSSRRGKYEQHCGTVPEINPEHCVACGQCVAVCPAGCLKISGKKISIDEKSCLGCGECAVVCKTRAIEIRWSETLENLQEKMVEYAKGVAGAFGSRIGYINFLIRVTKDCDCLAKDDPDIVNDLGILASNDPVAIDKASIDLILAAAKKDVFAEGHPETDWSKQLKYASSLGLGNMKYELEEVPE